jgi:hypothetical protein
MSQNDVLLNVSRRQWGWSFCRGAADEAKAQIKLKYLQDDKKGEKN